MQRAASTIMLALATMILPGVTIGHRATAADAGRTIRMGSFRLTVPEAWKPKQPRSRIIAYEFSVKPAEGDRQPGRITIMAAGGSVEQNLERWYSQFTQPDGRPTKEVAKVEKRKIAGQPVYLVDISGTYLDRPRPFGPGVERKNYRMLAAIIVTREGQIFVKFYGPQRTVAEQAEAFRRAIESLRAA